MNAPRPDRGTKRHLDHDLTALYTERSGLFHQLVAAAGLDPKTDFHRRDLRVMSFIGADLRGFNFSQSDLRGTLLRSAVYLDIQQYFRERSWMKKTDAG